MENINDKKNQWKASDLNKNKNTLKVLLPSKNKIVSANNTERHTKDDIKDKWGQTWEMMKHCQNKANGEEKLLFNQAGRDDRFLVTWKWKGCESNKKTMYSLRKAKRLYETIDLSGWEEVA